jgi:hypothetical protein
MPITTSLFAFLAMALRAAASFNDWGKEASGIDTTAKKRQESTQ